MSSPESFTLNGMTLVVVARNTAADLREKGYNIVADRMEEGQYHDLACKRPNGRKHWLVREYYGCTNEDGVPYRQIITGLGRA